MNFPKRHFIYELKLDGTRCLAYLDGTAVTLRDKRNEEVTVIYPELSEVGGQVSERCILDDEILVIKNGAPVSSNCSGAA